MARPVKINLGDKLAQIREHWQPAIVGELNGQHIKLAKIHGAFDWHRHVAEDEAFFVIDGRFRMEFREGHLDLGPGEMCIVPRGVEHRPVADDEAHIMLFEPAGTLNTGDAVTDRTVSNPRRI